MKKLFTLLSLGILFLVSGFAQQIPPLIVEQNEWSYYNRAQDFPGAPVIINRYIDWIEGDTVIDGISYKKLYSQINQNPHAFSGGLREDQGKVYLRPDSVTWQYYTCFANGPAEWLLYDFTAMPGDTIRTCHATMVVMNRDTIQIGNQSFIRLDVHNNNLLDNDFWIESMGSTRGFIGPLVGEFENGWKLTCFQNDSLIYGLDTVGYRGIPYLTDQCRSTVNIDKSLDLLVQVYPNPVEDMLTIDSGGLLNYDISLVNMLGQELEVKHVEQGGATLDMTGRKAGLYAVNITQNGILLYSQKVVKQAN